MWEYFQIDHNTIGRTKAARVGDVPEDQTATAKVVEMFRDVYNTVPTQEAAAILVLAAVIAEKG